MYRLIIIISNKTIKLKCAKMKEEVKRWLKKAKQDLDSAKYNYEGKKYDVSAFLCQQSSEKALKALLLEKSGQLRKILKCN